MVARLLATSSHQRLGWKRARMAATAERVHLAPVPAPAADQWATVVAHPDETRRELVRGHAAGSVAEIDDQRIGCSAQGVARGDPAIVASQPVGPRGAAGRPTEGR